MHSKCSFPNRSKLRDLFSRVQSPLCTRDGIYNNILYRPGNDKQRIVTARYESNNIHWYHGYLWISNILKVCSVELQRSTRCVKILKNDFGKLYRCAVWGDNGWENVMCVMGYGNLSILTILNCVRVPWNQMNFQFYALGIGVSKPFSAINPFS